MEYFFMQSVSPTQVLEAMDQLAEAQTKYKQCLDILYALSGPTTRSEEVAGTRGAVAQMPQNWS